MRSLARLVFVVVGILVITLVTLSILSILAANVIPSLWRSYSNPLSQLGFRGVSPGSFWSAFPSMAMMFISLGFFVLVLFALIRLLKGETPRGQAGRDAAESKTMQELYIRASHLEQRLESLETILFDRARSRTGSRKPG